MTLFSGTAKYSKHKTTESRFCMQSLGISAGKGKFIPVPKYQAMKTYRGVEV